MSQKGTLKKVQKKAKKIDLPNFMKEGRFLFLLHEIFKSNGFELRLVGGSLRDFLLSLDLEDYDLAINASPKEFCQILTKNNIDYVETGIEHGTITLKTPKSLKLKEQKGIELTSLRQDIETYGRKARVIFGTSWQVDALRRDFTINTLSLDFEGNIYDFSTGLTDLDNRLLRFVGLAEQRISEDYLRILRFFRFLSKLDLSYNTTDLKACIQAKSKLSELSIERISKELLQISSSKNFAKVLKMMIKHGIDEEIFNKSLTTTNPQIIEDLQRASDYYKSQKVSVCLPINLALFAIPSIELFHKLRLSLKLRKKIELLFDRCDDYNLEELIVEKYKIEDINNFLIIQYIKSKLKLSELKESQALLKRYDLAKFPLDGDDLKSYNFESKHEIGLSIRKARRLWVRSDFKLAKSQLIDKLGLC